MRVTTIVSYRRGSQADDDARTLGLESKQRKHRRNDTESDDTNTVEENIIVHANLKFTNQTANEKQSAYHGRQNVGYVSRL